MTELKIVLDTNVFLVILGKQSSYRWIFEKIISGEFTLCISTPIMLEYVEVIARKTNSQVAESIKDFLNTHPHVKHIDTYYQFQLITEDEDDNKFVDCAIASNALCLVSNDKHFKILKQIPFPKVNLLSLSEFQELFS
ncbi:putative toxin-antitoxin system toxin component, PIN family [Candidatus Albibeggiatoa sp. nov. BB20]|uniref:putative toxin-antitoxin system toxin component, PIN family n=1 Tax=Candidatus Albibeggiatoa sp. nov. BB20 TaxID=3162723 RepID=UPI0033654590